MHAIVETGGKQYKVAVGETLDVEELDVQVGDSVSLDKCSDGFGDDSAQVGKPIVEGAKVSADSRGAWQGQKGRLSSSTGPSSATASRRGTGSSTPGCASTRSQHSQG